MAQTNNFFYDIPLVSFTPGNANVDLNFMKSLADDYKLEVDKADAAKDALYGQLASVDVHDTFRDDYAQFMNNISTKIEQIDNNYQGKMIDRNYKNQLRSLIRSTQNDPELRYMIGTTKELRTYEQMKRDSKDYLDFNDTNVSAYDAVLNRAKGTKPQFLANKIYGDAKPESEIHNLASTIGIKEDTNIEREYDEFGVPTGAMYMIDTKTRTRTDITDKMSTMMNSYRETQGGQQLQRKAEANGTTYDALFIEQVNASARLLEQENVKTTLVKDAAAEYALQKQSIELQLKDLQLKRTQLEIGQKQFQATYDLEKEKLEIDATIKAVQAQLEALGDSTYNPANGGKNGSTGTGNIVPRYIGGTSQVVPPGTTIEDISTTAYRAEQAAAEKAATAMAQDVNARYRAASGTRDVASLIKQYSDGLTPELRQEAGNTIINTARGQMYLSDALQNDRDLYTYQQAYTAQVAAKKVTDKIDYEASKKFISRINGADSPMAKELINADVIYTGDSNRIADYSKAVFVDETKLLKYFGFQNELDKINEEATVFSATSAGIGLGSAYSSVYNTERYSMNRLNAIKNGAKDRYLTPERAAEVLGSSEVKANYDNAVNAAMADISRKAPIVGKWFQASNDALVEHTGGRGVTYKGYTLNPNANDVLAGAEKGYIDAVNKGLGGLNIYTDKGEVVRVNSDGQTLTVTNSTGKAVGGTYSYVNPTHIVLDKDGTYFVVAQMYELDPANVDKGTLNPSRIVTFKPDQKNIMAAVITPKLKATHGANVGTYMSAVFSENAQWIAANMDYAPTDTALVRMYDSTTAVKKNLDGTYLVQDTQTGKSRGASSEMELAELLSFIDYAKTQKGAPGMEAPDVKIDAEYKPVTIPSYEELISNIKVSTQSTTRRPLGPTTRVNVKTGQVTNIPAPPSIQQPLGQTGTQSNVQPTAGYTPQISSAVADGDYDKNVLFDGIFPHIKQLESKGDYKAVNDVTPPYQTTPTYAAGAYQIVPSWHNDTVKRYYKDYYGKDGFTIYGGPNNKKGKDYDAFLADAPFQDYVMKRMIDEYYIPGYNTLSPTIKNEVDITEYVVRAHHDGVAGARSYYSDVIIGTKILSEEELLRSEYYVKEVARLMGRQVKDRVRTTVLDEKLKPLEPDTTITLADGTEYTKQSPVGIAQYQFADDKEANKILTRLEFPKDSTIDNEKPATEKDIIALKAYAGDVLQTKEGVEVFADLIKKGIYTINGYYAIIDEMKENYEKRGDEYPSMFRYFFLRGVDTQGMNSFIYAFKGFDNLNILGQQSAAQTAEDIKQLISIEVNSAAGNDKIPYDYETVWKIFNAVSYDLAETQYDKNNVTYNDLLSSISRAINKYKTK